MDVELPGFGRQNIDVGVGENSSTIEAAHGCDAITRTVDHSEPTALNRVDPGYGDDVRWVTSRKQQ